MKSVELSAVNVRDGISEHFGLSVDLKQIEDQISDMQPGHDRILECFELDDEGRAVEVAVFMSTTSSGFVIALNAHYVGA